jgi:predicted 3-demethylubiquinone-9 3-methyltransferase (glyoxalase superfamily)
LNHDRHQEDKVGALAFQAAAGSLSLRGWLCCTGEILMPFRIQPFLMFQGNAEEAMRFYVSLFPGSEITDIVHYGPGQAGPEGTVMKAYFSLGEQAVMCIDSPVKHNFTFTPAFSFFVECQSEEELLRLSSALGKEGAVLMPLGNYGFSRQFTWLNDRYGVSWQLNLA